MQFVCSLPYQNAKVGFSKYVIQVSSERASFIIKLLFGREKKTVAINITFFCTQVVCSQNQDYLVHFYETEIQH